VGWEGGWGLPWNGCLLACCGAWPQTTYHSSHAHTHTLAVGPVSACILHTTESGGMDVRPPCTTPSVFARSPWATPRTHAPRPRPLADRQNHGTQPTHNPHPFPPRVNGPASCMPCPPVGEEQEAYTGASTFASLQAPLPHTLALRDPPPPTTTTSRPPPVRSVPPAAASAAALRLQPRVPAAAG
jgi:hypothetical protein